MRMKVDDTAAIPHLIVVAPWSLRLLLRAGHRHINRCSSRERITRTG